MRRSGARLTMSGALGRQPVNDSISSAGETTNSASLAQAEREVKALRVENRKLKADLEDVRSLYKQLVEENSHEKFDERRVTLLKSQVIQLERQVIVLSEALGARGDVLLEVENSMTWLADKCRSYIVKDVRGPEVSVPRSEFTLMVETAESARIKLYKRLENNTPEKLARPLLFYNEFIHPSRESDVTMLDVAYGNLNHLNLKHVTQLETKLSNLYKELIQLHTAIEEESQNNGCMWASGHVTTAARDRVSTRLLKSCAMMKDCSSSLMDLSMLFPSAPWPPLKKSALREVTAERVLRCLPGASRSRTGETQRVIEALVKAYNYRVYMLESQVSCLEAEVQYHRTLYHVQLKYTEDLFDAIREGYARFEEASNDVIVKPLKEVLEAYVELTTIASEGSLKSFLTRFKDNAAQLHDIVETIAVRPDESEAAKTLSSFGEGFFKSMDKLVDDQQRKRDQAASDIAEIRSEQQRLDQQLRDILQDQEARSQDSSVLTASPVTDTRDTSVNSEQRTSRRTSKGDDKRPVDRGNQARHQTEVKNSSCDSELSARGGDSRLSQDAQCSSHRDTTNQSRTKDGKEKPEWDNSIYNPSRETRSYESDESETENKDQNSSQPASENSEAPEEEMGTSPEKPPAPKPVVKKKLGYVPNTFVPNRTLKLRRSGSLTRLSNNSSTNTDNQSVSESVQVLQDNKKVIPGNSSSSRGRSGSRDRAASKLPTKKPAFK